MRKLKRLRLSQQKPILRKKQNMPKRSSSQGHKLKNLLRNSQKLLKWLQLNQKKLKLNNLKLSQQLFRMLLQPQLKVNRPINLLQKWKHLSQLFLKKLKTVP